MAESNKLLVRNPSKLNKKAGMLSKKSVLIFDLDGTLTESKANLDKEMSAILCDLLKKKKAVVIGGGNYPQFKKQFLNYLKCQKERLKNLLVLPTSGGRMYDYRAGKLRLIYKNILTGEEKNKILNAFKKALRDIHYVSPKKTFGKVLEDRESQITFSALGQKAPLAAKEEWNKKQDIRLKLRAVLRKYLPEFEVRLGGLTSIDVTKKGVDKAYGVRRVAKLLDIPIKDMAYIGDALYKGGNDYIVKKTGIRTVQIKNAEETKSLLRLVIKKTE